MNKTYAVPAVVRTGDVVTETKNASAINARTLNVTEIQNPQLSKF
jgi:hypothetical protein